MNKKTIRDIDIAKKKVLVRVDYNVSLHDGFKISDDFRLEQSLATLKYLLNQKCTVFLISHLGRPKGKRDKKYSLKPIAVQLEKLIKRKISFFDKDYISEAGRKELEKYGPGDIILLENIRFYPQEEENDLSFAKKLASLAEVFVNDAFGVSHRVHASVVGVAEFLPGIAGLLLEKEVDVIRRAIERPKKPLVAIIGGAKAEDKITLISKLLEKADYCLVGGGIANTFLKAWGYKVGRSLINRKMVEFAKHLFLKASRSNTAMLLPTDVVLGDLESGKVNGVIPADKIPLKWQALDIGPKTRKKFSQIINHAGTIIWVGPMGVYERKKFSHGTESIYKAICKNGASKSIIGGGNTIAALKRKRYLKTIDHVSTGGGAMLEFIEKETLPGIKVLEDK